MGQKIHPERLSRRLHPGLEVELVRREGLRRRPRRGPEDPRPHRRQTRPRRPLRHHDRAPRRGRRRHPHRPPGHRDRQVGQRSRRAAQGPAQADRQAGQGEHPRGQAPRARRQTGRPVDRRAAAEPGRLPARDETRPDLGDALRRQGRARSRSPGRLGGAEMARTEGYSDGRVPLHTLRANIDYGFFEARTTAGRIGVKCWINKGEVMPEGFRSDQVPEATASRRRPAARRRRPRRRAAASAGRWLADADAEAGQAPQTDARPDARQHQGRQHASPSASTG